jgi:hypothetical protein
MEAAEADLFVEHRLPPEDERAVSGMTRAVHASGYLSRSSSGHTREISEFREGLEARIAINLQIAVRL